MQKLYPANNDRISDNGDNNIGTENLIKNNI